MKKVIHLFYIGIIFSILFLAVNSPDTLDSPNNTNKIKGKVVSADDLSLSISGVLLFVDEGNEVLTNSKGQFLIEDLEPGFHKIKLSKTGYRDKTVSVLVGEKSITRSVIFLDEESVHLVKR